MSMIINESFYKSITLDLILSLCETLDCTPNSKREGLLLGALDILKHLKHEYQKNILAEDKEWYKKSMRGHIADDDLPLRWIGVLHTIFKSRDKKDDSRLPDSTD